MKLSHVLQLHEFGKALLGRQLLDIPLLINLIKSVSKAHQKKKEYPYLLNKVTFFNFDSSHD